MRHTRRAAPRLHELPARVSGHQQSQCSRTRKHVVLPACLAPALPARSPGHASAAKIATAACVEPPGPHPGPNWSKGQLPTYAGSAPQPGSCEPRRAHRHGAQHPGDAGVAAAAAAAAGRVARGAGGRGERVRQRRKRRSGVQAANAQAQRVGQAAGVVGRAVHPHGALAPEQQQCEAQFLDPEILGIIKSKNRWLPKRLVPRRRPGCGC